VVEWDDTVIDTCGDDTEDPADDITITSRFVGRFEITLRQRAPGAPLVFTGRGHEVSTYTNTETGRSWTGVFSWLDKDIKVLSLDEEFATLRIATVFHFVIFDEGGRRDSRNDGRFSSVVVVDLSTDEVVDEYDFRVVGRGGVGDFCADAQRFTVD
ncbi:MAG: hypothetical protein H5T83_04150, partial [Actinotalea sp.]|nr:hypothetical protein [Actinotalea sp.]